MKLQDKVQDALQESRILILGAQILVGLHARAVYEQLYEKQPLQAQALGIGALFAMLFVVGMLIAPVCYHRIAARGEDTQEVSQFANRSTEIALVPFAAVLGTDLYLAAGTFATRPVAIALGVTGVLLALVFWFLIELLAKPIRPGGPDESGPTPLSVKIDHVLTETRVVLPGAQAILGFQFVAFFSESFQRLPDLLKGLHLASLLLISLCVVLLMTPAAFHRLAERGEDTERFHSVGNFLVLSAMVPLALAIALDFYVVSLKVLANNAFSLGAALLLLLYFMGLWFGYTLHVRRRSD